LLTATALLFLLAAAALAVDTSMFFQQARSEQRVADLACLAGVQELPENPAAAVQKAAEFLRPNHPDLSDLTIGATPTPGVNTYTGGGFEIEIETPWNGESTQMRVSVSQDRETHFARAIGATEVAINQVAYCEVGSALGAGADMPFGVLTTFTGGVIDWEQNKCTLNQDESGGNSSKCGGLAIPRHNNPVGSQFQVRNANNYIANMVAGINWEIAPASQDIVCELVQTGGPEPCNRVATVSGDEPSKVYRGLISGKPSMGFAGDDIGYLERDDGGPRFAWGSDWYDGHRLSEVANCVGGCPTEEQATTWGSAVQPSPVTIDHVMECDCPRFARIPIVQSFPDNSANCNSPHFDPDDPTALDLCTAKIVDFQWVYIMRPFFNGQGPTQGPNASFVDFSGGGNSSNLKTVAAVLVNFTPDVQVDGECFSEFREGAPKAVRLIGG
jgi:hypothetical protein